MEFKWNSDQAFINLRKHGISIREAATVFNDPLAITSDNFDHSLGENRYITISLSKERRLIILLHTDRNNKTRIISARQATSKEKKIMNGKIKNELSCLIVFCIHN
jgi:uncharacterized DUF497 family protein